MMNTRTQLSFFFGAALAGLVLSLPVWAEVRGGDSPEARSSVMLDGVKIEFSAKKSTLSNIPLKALDDDGLALAYLPGAFEPTAAGEASRVSTVNENRNDQQLSRYDDTDSRLQSEFRESLAKLAASLEDEGFSRSDGNVKGRSQVVSLSR